MDFSYETTDRIGARATLGLITLQSDETIEHDMVRILHAPDVALYVSRVPSDPEVHSETLARMEGHMTDSARLLPESLDYAVVGYGCTSGTSVIGAERVAELVSMGTRTAEVTQPLSSLIAACQHLGVERLAMLSPYVAEVSETLRAALLREGIATPVFGSFGEAREEKVARIAPQSIIAAACELAAQGGADAIFMSCTNLRTLDVIEAIEDQTALPVLTSNQVLGWNMARLAGIDPAGRFGRLMA